MEPLNVFSLLFRPFLESPEKIIYECFLKMRNRHLLKPHGIVQN